MLTWYEKDEFLRTAKILSAPLPAIERWNFLETAKRLLAIAVTPDAEDAVVEELRAEVKALSIMLREMEAELSESDR
jgi:preprotein translocase subunit Sss1